MKKSGPWLLTVQRTERITPNMQRITFGGEGLTGFPEDIASAYLKISFPDKESAAVRSYTVRSFDPDSLELEVDFVVHGDHGIASGWAVQASAGDTLEAGGPGPKKLLDLSGDWFLLVGDMSALPAIGANLARLPADAKGYAVIEVLDDADRQPLDVPENVAVHWIVNPDPNDSARQVMDIVSALEWFDGRCDAWVAGELDTVREVRSYLKSERGLSRQQMYASSYWQLGSTDEQHRVAKRADQEAANGKLGRAPIFARILRRAARTLQRNP
jgi:NADPH-dependent ferric siderophore reductase